MESVVTGSDQVDQLADDLSHFPPFVPILLASTATNQLEIPIASWPQWDQQIR